MATRTGRRAPALLAVVVIGSMIAATPAAGTGVDHGAVVAEAPRPDTPDFVDGEVRAGQQVGNRVLVGGSFTRVRDAVAGVVDQANLASYDLHTGRVDPAFRPDINGPVNSIADVGDGTIVVVGQFTNVDGRPHRRIARLRVVDGSLVDGFTANADRAAIDVAVANGRAYVGGSFTTVNGVARMRLAAVDVATGAVDPGFDLPVTGETGLNGSGSVRGVDVAPDGDTLAVVHNDRFVNGAPRQGVALIDISGATATLLEWRTRNYDYDCQPWFPQFTRPLMRDVQFSPDGSWIAVASAIGNYAPGCDVVVRFPTSGEDRVAATWVSRMFDSPEALAVSDEAIYVGGHMRWAQAPGTVYTDFRNGNTDNQPTGTVVRDQIMAISPADGTALDWDPGAGGFRGVLALETTDAGLLAGSDGDRFGGEALERHALFELPADPPPTGARPMTAIRAPSAGGTVGRRVAVVGSASDDRGVGDVAMTIRSLATGDYLQRNGSFGPAAYDLSPFVPAVGQETSTVLWIGNLPDGAYVIEMTASDESGAPDRTPAVIEVAVDAGPPDSAPPDGAITSPGRGSPASARVNISGIAWDETALGRVRVIVKDLDRGLFLQADGAFRRGRARLVVALEDPATPLSHWSWTGDLPDGRFQVRLHVVDAAGGHDPTQARLRLRVRT